MHSQPAGNSIGARPRAFAQVSGRRGSGLGLGSGSRDRDMPCWSLTGRGWYLSLLRGRPARRLTRAAAGHGTQWVIWDGGEASSPARFTSTDRVCLRHVESHKISRLHTHLRITTRNGIDYAHAAHCTLCSPGSGSGNLNRCISPHRMQQDPMT